MTTDYPAVTTHHPVLRVLRIGVSVLLLLGLSAAVWTLFGTRFGTQLRESPLKLAGDVRTFVAGHPLASIGAYLLLYMVLGLFLMPVWWLQLLGGAAFGLYRGTALSLVCSAVGATIASIVARLLAAEYFHTRIETSHQRLRKLDELLGHNGLLVVMTSRLTHFLPFGLCNYAFGILNISLRDIFIGTLLGGIPATAVYAAAGAGFSSLGDWRFYLVIGGINLLLLVPLGLRYTRPDWFKKIGIE